MRALRTTALVSMTSLAAMTLALAQQPTAPPAAAQEPASMGEKAGRVLDQVTGNPLASADVDMRRVMDALAELGPKTIEQISPQEARQQPTPADAVAALLKKEGKNPDELKKAMGVTTKDMTYPTAGGTQPIRAYMPEGATAGGAGLPVIVYYHGGGWVFADLDVYDATPRAMAMAANAIVMSVEYRKAPENKFPASHDDAVAAYKWVLENAASMGGDPKRIAVMGESAGGNLAINVAIAARDQNLQRPVSQILVYPVAGVNMETPSYVANESAKPLNKAMMAWFVGHVVKSDADKQDPRIDLIGKANLKDLPPTTVITAQIDPLMSDGQMLAEKLTAAGVKTMHRNYEGVTHEFFGMAAVVGKAKEAQAFAVQQLKASFSAPDATAATPSSSTPATSTGSGGAAK